MYVFACIGVLLVGGFFAVKWGLTNVPGAIDLNDRFFTQQKVSRTDTPSSSSQIVSEAKVRCSLSVIARVAPENAALITHVYEMQRDDAIVQDMITALGSRLGDAVQKEIERTCSSEGTISVATSTSNVFTWMNTDEWRAFHAAVVKDTALINEVAATAGVSSRLIVSQLVGEQMRLYFSDRELFKQVFAPLKILGSETQFSLGVSGIKEGTAQLIENHLKDPQSIFYLGSSYEHMLDFKTDNPTNERVERITDSHNHRYAYLYTALFIQQIETQWKNAGFDVSHRPEIIATIFNLGFGSSHPNDTPHVGGASININGTAYTFGSLAYEFYYSGDLADEFPL